MVRERKFWKQNQLWTLLVAAVILFNLLGNSGVSVATGAENLTLTMHDGESVAVAYSSITEAELLEKAGYGTALEGKETKTGKSGTWEHPQWGSYTLCVYASSELAVRLTTEEGCYVVNLGSDEETRQLYQIIQEKMSVSR